MTNPFRLLALVAILGLGLTLTTVAQGQDTRIYVVNQSTQVSDFALRQALQAFQLAVDRDFAPVWHADAELQFSYSSPPPGAWSITITDDVDCWCAGYHGQAHGVPFARVFPLPDTSWTVTFSHELFEMLADPYTAYPRVVHTRRGFYMVEVSDPVEAERYGYQVNGILISDFVEPSWYVGGRRPYDFTGSTRRPRQLLPNGYQIVWRHGGWDWLFG